MESALLKLFVFVRIEAEQLCRAMSPDHLCFFERNQQAEAQDLFAEIPLIQTSSKNGFVKMLKLGKRELWRQQLETDRLVTHLAFEPLKGGSQDVRVVEREFRNFGNWKPFGVRRIRGRSGVVIRELNQRKIRDADDALAGIAIHRAKRVELFEEHVGQPSFFRQFAARGIVDGFIHVNESARQCQASLKRLQGALNEQYLELTFIEAEDNAVHGQSRTGIFVCMWHMFRISALIRGFSKIIECRRSGPFRISSTHVCRLFYRRVIVTYCHPPACRRGEYSVYRRFNCFKLPFLRVRRYGDFFNQHARVDYKRKSGRSD